MAVCCDQTCAVGVCFFPLISNGFFCYLQQMERNVCDVRSWANNTLHLFYCRLHRTKESDWAPLTSLYNKCQTKIKSDVR